MAGGRTKPIPTGMRFGKWVVLGRDNSAQRSCAYYRCRCDCGAIKSVGSVHLRAGKTTQCQSCSNRASSTSHGESRGKAVEYGIWQRMIRRCQVQPGYVDRGISVCAEWLGSDGYTRFLEHVGRRPGPAYSVDRIDNARGYEPGNVRWATRVEQARNTRSNRELEIDGDTRCVAEWAEVSGVSANTIYSRLRRGWSPEEAVFRRVA